MQVDGDSQYAKMESHQMVVRAKKPTDNAIDMSLITMACCDILESLTGFDPYDSLHHYKECVEPLIKNDHNC